eukprot:m.42673 g.42673  ORF g.42673 m.42673 type:complete len:87 (-) comp46511_c0_seq1:182-442(-)
MDSEERLSSDERSETSSACCHQFEDLMIDNCSLSAVRICSEYASNSISALLGLCHCSSNVREASLSRRHRAAAVFWRTQASAYRFW